MYLEAQIPHSSGNSKDQKQFEFLHQHFEHQVSRRPDHVAVESNGEKLTYAELDRQANRIANILKKRGVGPGSLVAVYLTRSVRLYASILAVLKAGGGYLPIDPKFPMDRVRDILEDSGAHLAISEAELAEELSVEVDLPLLELDAENREIASADDKAPATEDLRTSDICYVIYTSGSTGRPKGVMIEHRNALAFVSSLSTVYRLTENDRIYQGFSVAFDASVEELWAAFSLGGTLVAPPEATSRSPIDAAEFLTENNITFFSTIPTFLAMIDQDLPTVKTLIVGGEVCAQELVTRWVRDGRRMLNTYGPTETAVVATWFECQPDLPVTIGGPLPGYEAYVLDENLQPAKMGETGELYIGGPGVARGYRDRDQLTAERFIANPFKPDETNARLYRTFDLVSCNMNGQLEFVGRSDGQIKIRGFRVELPEIEAVFMEQADIQAAAVRVYEKDGVKDLAAYIVTENEDGLDRDEIAQTLKARLPEYMIPKFLDILTELPLMNSGKVDRNQLPDPVETLTSSSREMVEPADDLETTIRDAWAECLGLDSVSVIDNFFNDLQGHSLAAAKVTSKLRTALNLPGLAVRDIYKNPTVRAYAEAMRDIHLIAKNDDQEDSAPPKKSKARIQFEQGPNWKRWMVVGLQAISLAIFYGILTSPVVYATLMYISVTNGSVSLHNAALLTTILAFAWWPTMVLLSIGVKWLVIGRFKAGAYPLWSFYYYRWWVVTLFQKLNWIEVLSGTPLINIYLRAMGAKVGPNAMLDTHLFNAFDLISIGENASIGNESQLLGYRVEDGMLVLGRVEIGRDCFVGMHACLGLNTRMEFASKLDDMSLLNDDEGITLCEGRKGTPAFSAEVSVPERRSTPGAARRFMYGLAHLALIYVMGYFLIATFLPSMVLVAAALIYYGPVAAAGAAILAAPLFLGVYVGALYLVKRFIIGRIKPGAYEVHSLHYLRHWFLEYLMRNTRYILLPVYATIYMAPLLRMLGARIGGNSEVSTVMNVSPDLLTIGERTFLADACIIGGHRVHNGIFEIKETKIGDGTFIGNSAFVPGGSVIGDDVLIGVMSTPPETEDGATPSGTRWLGNPSFPLPATQRNICFATETISNPDRKTKLTRAAYDAVRILLPNTLVAVSLILTVALVATAYAVLPLWAVIASTPLIGALIAAWLIEVSALIKHIGCAKMEPTVQPLWCRFVWSNELVNGVYESLAAPAMNPLLGTPFISPALRQMGVKIGRWAYVETTLMSEFDLVEIGDFAALNLGSTIQNHLFEDRVFKADKLRIGEGATISNMAVVLYDTEMKTGAHLSSLSVLMKGENLPGSTRWVGVPCEQQKHTPSHEPSERTVKTMVDIIAKIGGRRIHNRREREAA